MAAITLSKFMDFVNDELNQVSSTKRLPINAALLTVSVACLLGLINIGSSVALDDVLYMAVSGLYLSYFTVGSLLLYRRCKGHISRSNDHDEIINVPGAKLVWGSFHVPGMWGILINGYAVIYMIIVIFFSFRPTERAVTAESMNYSVVGTLGTIILALVYYALRARKIYRGPVIELSRG